MSSEIIIVLLLVAVAIAGIIYLERHSRRNARGEASRAGREETD